MENKESKSVSDAEWEQRTLCSDESCIGVIGPDGLEWPVFVTHAPGDPQRLFVLERAGFGSSRRLAGIFYFRDMAVLKVMFSGLVTAMLGKMPKSGDEATLKNLKFTVEKVRMHRIESLILKLEPLGADGQ